MPYPVPIKPAREYNPEKISTTSSFGVGARPARNSQDIKYPVDPPSCVGCVGCGSSQAREK